MIVITGPTGQISQQVIPALLNDDQPVRVIARDPGRLPADVRDKVEVVQGLHSDAAVLTEAFAGANTALWLVPPFPTADDIAAAALELLTDESWTGQVTVPVISPDSLTPNQMAQMLSDVLEKNINYQQVNGDLYKSTMMQYGMSESWAQRLIDMAKAQSKGL